MTGGLVTNYCILATVLVRKPYDDINSIDTGIAAAANRHQTEQKSRSNWYQYIVYIVSNITVFHNLLRYALTRNVDTSGLDIFMT